VANGLNLIRLSNVFISANRIASLAFGDNGSGPKLDMESISLIGTKGLRRACSFEKQGYYVKKLPFQIFLVK
jgi:hypothetical protein